MIHVRQIISISQKPFCCRERNQWPKNISLGHKIDKNGYFLSGRKIKKYRYNEAGVLLIILAKMKYIALDNRKNKQSLRLVWTIWFSVSDSEHPFFSITLEFGGIFSCLSRSLQFRHLEIFQRLFFNRKRETNLWALYKNIKIKFKALEI